MAKGDSKKPKGRMSAYTFFVQTCREEHRKKHPNENVNFTEFSKKCAERWKQMTDKEKKRFAEMAERDKQRYDREMSTYTPPAGEGGRNKRKKKDPNAPKRPLSAFFLFCHDERPGVKAIHPNYSVGEVAKELGERWNKVSADVKAKYEAKAAQDKSRYEKDMAGYKAKKGKEMSSKGEKKPKGRMSNYTFFVQMCREEHRKKHPNENVNFTEFSKKCAERWKQMTDKEKKRFAEMAERDKQRYDREMATYTPPSVHAVVDNSRRRKKKDPNAPKRPLSAFFLYCADERPAVKALYPNYSVGEAAKELSDRWNKVTAEVKAKYEAKAAQDKTRYDRESANYKQKIGKL